MSGSPKYTTVSFEQQRQAQLAAQRAQREAERRQREEAARQRRIAAATRALQLRTARVAAQLEALRLQSAGLSQVDAVGRESTQLMALRGDLSNTADEPGLTRLNKALRDSERRVDRLGAEIARELTQREQAGAVALVVAQLDAVADRDVHDPEGHRAATALVGEARAAIGDARRFGAVHTRLVDATGTHLERVRDRQARLARLAADTDEVGARLTAVLDDAAKAGVVLPDLAELRADLAELEAEADGQHVTRWEHRISALRRRTEAVTATVDARLDELERMAIIVEAASVALPAAGLAVVAGSLSERDDAVTFAARRADGTTVELTVHAGDGRGTRLEYRTDAGDTVVTETPEGELRSCDVTEQLLEQFHTELARQGVHADGLHWAGKPDRRPPPAVNQLQVPGTRSRG